MAVSLPVGTCRIFRALPSRWSPVDDETNRMVWYLGDNSEVQRHGDCQERDPDRRARVVETSSEDETRLLEERTKGGKAAGRKTSAQGLTKPLKVTGDNCRDSSRARRPVRRGQVLREHPRDADRPRRLSGHVQHPEAPSGPRHERQDTCGCLRPLPKTEKPKEDKTEKPPRLLPTRSGQCQVNTLSVHSDTPGPSHRASSNLTAFTVNSFLCGPLTACLTRELAPPLADRSVPAQYLDPHPRSCYPSI